MSEDQKEELKVIAVVSMTNQDVAIILNRKLNFVYERVGNDYIGKDGPFRDVLAYERGSGRFVAFAGRELQLNMCHGGMVRIKDHWWSSHIPGHASVAVSDVESLKKTYVFRGGVCIDPAELEALRSSYSGPVYSYWDYEKIVKQRIEAEQ